MHAHVTPKETLQGACSSSPYQFVFLLCSNVMLGMPASKTSSAQTEAPLEMLGYTVTLLHNSSKREGKRSRMCVLLLLDSQLPAEALGILPLLLSLVNFHASSAAPPCATAPLPCLSILVFFHIQGWPTI